jgi:hypothetical protein
MYSVIVFSKISNERKKERKTARMFDEHNQGQVSMLLHSLRNRSISSAAGMKSHGISLCLVANCFRVKKKREVALSLCREEIIGCHSLLNGVNT